MKRIKDLIITLMIMITVSIICLFIVSILTYTYKWKADKALIGITGIYIFTGFIGGLVQKIRNKKEKSIGRKMLEAILFSVIFMVVLITASIFILQIPFVVSSRFLMIFMLLVGSACLGRIL